MRPRTTWVPMRLPRAATATSMNWITSCSGPIAGAYPDRRLSAYSEGAERQARAWISATSGVRYRSCRRLAIFGSSCCCIRSPPAKSSDARTPVLVQRTTGRATSVVVDEFARTGGAANPPRSAPYPSAAPHGQQSGSFKRRPQTRRPISPRRRRPLRIGINDTHGNPTPHRSRSQKHRRRRLPDAALGMHKRPDHEAGNPPLDAHALYMCIHMCADEAEFLLPPPSADRVVGPLGWGGSFRGQASTPDECCDVGF